MLYHFSEPELESDFHAVVSIQLIELIDEGIVNFSSKDFDFNAYNKEVRDELWKQFEGRYAYREIGLLPYKVWHKRLIGKLNEIIPKYNWMFKALEEDLTPMQAESEYNKSRNIDSDFPQTLLDANSDYASYGRDFEHERIKYGNFLEMLEKLKDVQSIYSMILDELETLFSCLVTVSINAR